MGHSREVKVLNNELAMAIQQLTSYSYARKGYVITDLIDAMGLDRKEWATIKDQCKEFMREEDYDLLNLYLDTGEM